MHLCTSKEMFLTSAIKSGKIEKVKVLIEGKGKVNIEVRKDIDLGIVSRPSRHCEAFISEWC